MTVWKGILLSHQRIKQYQNEGIYTLQPRYTHYSVWNKCIQWILFFLCHNAVQPLSKCYKVPVKNYMELQWKYCNTDELPSFCAVVTRIDVYIHNILQSNPPLPGASSGMTCQLQANKKWLPITMPGASLNLKVFVFFWKLSHFCWNVYVSISVHLV